MASAQVSRGRGRIDVIDAARGVAMLFVFLAHFIDAFYRGGARPIALFMATRLATPAFFWISGVTLAVLYARNRERWATMRDRLIDRGLFLLVVAHLLFIPAGRFIESNWHDTLRIVFVTDTIGLCVIVGATLIPRVGVLGRLLIGLFLLGTAWTLTTTWHPAVPSAAWWIKDFLVGDLQAHWLRYNFPPVPWLGIYLIGSAAGSVFARRYDSGSAESLARPVAFLGGGLILAGLLVRSACHAITGTTSEQAAILSHLGALTNKLPPSPAYLLFYLGCGLLMFAALLGLRNTGLGRVVNRFVAPFGKYSLAAFLFQFYTYYMLVTVIPHPPRVLIPVYFAATVVLLRFLVSAWSRMNGNRLITIGYPAISTGLTDRYRTLSGTHPRVTGAVDQTVEPPPPTGPRPAL